MAGKLLLSGAGRGPSPTSRSWQDAVPKILEIAQGYCMNPAFFNSLFTLEVHDGICSC